MPLSRKQKEVLIGTNHSYIVSSGSVSSGKTFLYGLMVYDHLYSLPNNSLFAIVGKTSESVYLNIIREILKYDLIGDMVFTKAPYKIVIKSTNVEILVVSGDNESSWARAQGTSTAGAYFDEVTNLPENLVKTVCKNCRQGGKVWAKFFTCNPDHPNHWFKRDFMENPDLDLVNHYFTLTDNPALEEDYKKEIISMYTGAMYDRMILGKWVLAEGVVYDKFSRSEHIVEDYRRDQVLEYVIGIDWGYEHPLALVLFAVDYDGNYWQIDEIYLKHQLIDKTLVAIMKSQGWFDLKIGDRTVQPTEAYGDSARPEYIALFHQLTGIVTYPADKRPDSVAQGIQMVQNKLVKKGNGEYGYRVLSKCIKTINEFESYSWAKNKTGTKDEPVKDHDHALDAVRYTIYTRDRGKVKVLDKNLFRLDS